MMKSGKLYISIPAWVPACGAAPRGAVKIKENLIEVNKGSLT